MREVMWQQVVREAAEGALKTLDEYGWFGHDGPLDGELCAGMALPHALNTMTSKKQLAPGWWPPAAGAFLRTAEALFPGRTPGGIIGFNDHPDTTEEDVRLVLKGMTGDA